MKRIAFLFFTILLSIYSYGQIKFEPGYFIDNNGIRIECVIKNSDWLNNPISFIYKLSETDSTSDMKIENVKEFGIIGYCKYIRATVDIDQSGESLYNTSITKDPIWSNETVFLNVLLEGKATLYYYKSENLYRFFYSISDSIPKQLIYKQYRYDDRNIAFNNKFRQQLWLDVSNEKTKPLIATLNCNREDLLSYFKKFNTDNSAEKSLSFEKKTWKSKLNISVTPGIDVAAINLYNYTIRDEPFKLSRNANIRLGVEAEVVLPFNRNKWGIIIEPTYHQYKSDTLKFYYYKPTFMNFKYIDVALGIKYNFFINKDLQIFILGSILIPQLAHTIESEFNFLGRNDLGFKVGYGYSFGGGLNFKRVSCGIRYYTKTSTKQYYGAMDSYYGKTSVIFGYRLFSTK